MTTSAKTPPPATAGPVRRLGPALSGPYAGIWIATALLFAVSAIAVPDSMTGQSLLAMFPFWAVLAIMSIGQMLVVQQRGIDLSIPGTATLAAMVFVTLVGRHGTPFPLALLYLLIMAIVIGLFNGLLVTRVNVTPLITTLAVNGLLAGAMLSYTQGEGTSAPAGLASFAASRPLGFPAPAWVAIGVALAFAFLMRWTVAGRRFVAVGASPDAARATGIRVNAYVIGAYIGSAVLATGGAVLLTGYVQNPDPTIGDPYLFQTVMAVVIGGTSLIGGRGSVVATAVAALFLSQLGQVVLTLGAGAAVQQFVQVVALVLATVGATLLSRRSRRVSQRSLARRLRQSRTPADRPGASEPDSVSAA
jgi:ribose transport system permease protein